MVVMQDLDYDYISQSDQRNEIASLKGDLVAEHELRIKYLNYILKGYSETRIDRMKDIPSYATRLKWRHSDPSYDEKVKEARREASYIHMGRAEEEIEDLLDCAKAGEADTVYANAVNQLVKHKQFLAKVHNQEVFGEKREVTHKSERQDEFVKRVEEKLRLEREKEEIKSLPSSGSQVVDAQFNEVVDGRECSFEADERFSAVRGDVSTDQD